ncbi:predicted protein [Uncinocarpus reesii 1704]|uniref:Uncharacterized protein n=1 Tax=Uncinocarpus reesii (strain UAMH 1704) TaxID=336963 RepID=C4JVR9_UNCRE|nr:uncharacterized protein UREG_06661 [Uncinocarpus reesii 1704]EEP81796.1 predicted protein [Uncinocarpus reesii 1704]
MAEAKKQPKEEWRTTSVRTQSNLLDGFVGWHLERCGRTQGAEDYNSRQPPMHGELAISGEEI